MSKYLIVVEGKADIVFLRDYLMFLYSNLNIIKNFTKKNRKEIVFKSDSIEIKILVAGGYTKIKENKILTSIKEHIDYEYKILIIQDADNPDKDNGGVQNRMEYLDKIKDIKFETFLFPNHKDDGDLETLLLRIIDRLKYDSFLSCYKNYVTCIKEITQKDFITELLEDKNRVFSYFSAYYGMENSKEENREYIEDYWDLKSNALKALEKFIKNNIES